MLEEEVRKLDKCNMEGFGRPESSEKTIVILGDRWWPQTVKQDGDRISAQFLGTIRKRRNERPNVGGVSLLGVGTMPRLERDEWSTVKSLRQATNEYAPPPSQIPPPPPNIKHTMPLPPPLNTKRAMPSPPRSSPNAKSIRFERRRSLGLMLTSRTSSGYRSLTEGEDPSSPPREAQRCDT